MLIKSTNFAPEQEPQEGMVKPRVGMVFRTLKKNSDTKWMVRYDKWVGPKVCYKFNHPPGYVIGLILKSSVSVFSMHLFQGKHIAACA